MITIDLSELVGAINETGTTSAEILNILVAQISAQNTLLGFIAALLLAQIFAIVWGKH